MWFWLFWISLSINLLGTLYIRWLLKIIININKQIDDVAVVLKEFRAHLKSVYELEMFYGDDTLKSLMDHAAQLSGNLQEMELILNEEKETDAEETDAEEKTKEN